MKILIVPDISGWAIDQLAQEKIKNNPHHTFRCVYVHPRDASDKTIQQNFLDKVKEFNPDIIHFEYFRSCSQLLEALPELRNFKIILTHHNQRTKALREYDWHSNGVNYLVTHTNKCKKYLVDECKQLEENVFVINHGIDLDYFEYSDEEPNERHIGYAGRIVPWKGLKEIAEVSQEEGYPVMFMGRHDKVDYWNQISAEAKNNINFSFMECKDSERLDYYKSLSCYIGNSKDGYEEGTLEYLEAMACGVPVITTLNGVAGDIAKDGENCLVIPFEDKEALREAIKRVMTDKELRNKIRKGGWETVKNMTAKKMSYQYSLLYNKLNNESEQLVSVIIPTTLDRMEQISEILKSLEKQTHLKLEVILAFDEVQIPDNLIDEIKSNSTLTIKYIVTGKEGYNLAMARNMGAIESEGEFLLFCDSRLKPDKMSISIFVQAMDMNPANTWSFGNKGANKASFVENFSCIRRTEFFKFGMMNERITKYGGLSQETRTRWIGQSNNFIYVEDAMAEQLITSKNSSQKRKDIVDTKFQLYKMYHGNNH